MMTFIMCYCACLLAGITLFVAHLFLKKGMSEQDKKDIANLIGCEVKRQVGANKINKACEKVIHGGDFCHTVDEAIEKARLSRDDTGCVDRLRAVEQE